MTDSLKMQDDNRVSGFGFRVSSFSTAYLPPVSYFIAMMRSGKVELEAHENFVKQSYRNRCRIATANGVETLSIPIESNKGEKINIREARIAPHDNWQKNHWRAITSAYRNSPFFEFYEDDFKPFYEKKWKFLWDYNLELLTLMLELLDVEADIQLTTDYQSELTHSKDFREFIHPKKETVFDVKPYYQVFESKHGFIADLSIIDLLLIWEMRVCCISAPAQPLTPAGGNCKTLIEVYAIFLSVLLYLYD